MSGGVYMSGVFHIGELGDKLGIRRKYCGEEWGPAQFKIPLTPPRGGEARDKHGKGLKLDIEEFPEGIAVWNEQAFTKARDVLWAGPFLTVKAKIAEVLSRFNLGDGGLVQVPLFKADLTTPWPDPYYYINFGGPKDTLLPEESRSLHPLIPRQPPSKNTYRVIAPSDGDIALSSAATLGADIWIEQYVWHELFLSEALVDALRDAQIDVDLHLARCRIVEGK